MSRYTKYIIGVVAIMLTTGCRSSKQTIADYEAVVTDATESYYNMVDSCKEWHDVTMPVKVELKSPSSMSVSGRARMVKDESLYISFRVFGMEVAQLYVDQDSIHATYKLKKMYISESLSEIKGNFPLTLGNLQDIMLGRAFLIGDNHLERSDIKSFSLVNTDGKSWNLIPRAAPSGKNYGFRFSATNLIDRLVAYTTDESVLVTCEYTEHQTTPAGAFARKTDISVNKGDRNIEAALVWNLGNASWDTGVVNEWQAPKGYTRLPLNKVLKAVTE